MPQGLIRNHIDVAPPADQPSHLKHLEKQAVKPMADEENVNKTNDGTSARHNFQNKCRQPDHNTKHLHVKAVAHDAFLDKPAVPGKNQDDDKVNRKPYSAYEPFNLGQHKVGTRRQQWRKLRHRKCIKKLGLGLRMPRVMVATVWQ